MTYYHSFKSFCFLRVLNTKINNTFGNISKMTILKQLCVVEKQLWRTSAVKESSEHACVILGSEHP